MNAECAMAPRGFRAWWLRKTVQRPRGYWNGEFIAEVHLRPGWWDRIAMLFGREMIVHVSSEHEPTMDEKTVACFNAIRAHSWTQPKALSPAPPEETS